MLATRPEAKHTQITSCVVLIRWNSRNNAWDFPSRHCLYNSLKNGCIPEARNAFKESIVHNLSLFFSPTQIFRCHL